MVLCKVILRRPTARGKFLYNIRAPEKVRKKNQALSATFLVVQNVIHFVTVISKDTQKNAFGKPGDTFVAFS